MAILSTDAIFIRVGKATPRAKGWVNINVVDGMGRNLYPFASIADANWTNK